MGAPWAYRPSAGLWMVVLIHLSAVGLIGWGATTPLLDRIWTLEHQLKSGRRSEVTLQDRETFREGFRVYPGLAAGLLDGRDIALLSAHRGRWSSEGSAVVGRLPGSERKVFVRVESSANELPVEVVLEGDGWRQQLTFDTSGALGVTLPARTSAEVIQVTARGGKKRSAKVAFRFSFEESP